MYSRQQDTFARGFAVFLLFFISFGVVAFASMSFAPSSLIALVPRWMEVAFSIAWPVLSFLVGVRFRNHRGVQNLIWSKQSTRTEEEMAKWNLVVNGIQTKLKGFGFKLVVVEGLVYVGKASADGFDVEVSDEDGITVSFDGGRWHAHSCEPEEAIAYFSWTGYGKSGWVSGSRASDVDIIHLQNHFISNLAATGIEPSVLD